MDRRNPALRQNRSFKFPQDTAVNRYPVSSLVRKLIALVLPLGVVIAGTMLLIAPIWGQGYPWGSDVWGHLQRAEHMGQLIGEYGLLEGMSRGAWMPQWYLGDPMTVYYPPMTVLVIAPIVALVGNVFLAYRIFITGLCIFLGLSVYFIGKRWQGDSLVAICSALLAVGAPYTLHTVFVEGNLGRGIALAIFPWLVWQTEQLLREKAIHSPFLALSLLWALTINAHVMQCVIFAVAIGIYIVLRVLNNAFIPLRRGLLALVPIGLGAGIAAAYLLPAYSQFELSNVPYLPVEKIYQFVATSDALLPYHNNIEMISVGIATIVVAVTITLRTTKDYNISLLGTGVVCLVLSFGPAAGIYHLLPLNQSMLPERFLNASSLIFVLIIATTPTEILKRRWVLLLCVVGLVIDVLPAARDIFMRPAPPDEQAIAQTLAEQPLTGRVAPLMFPDTTSSLIYLTSQIANRDNVSGWALENTPNQSVLRRLLTAVDRSPAYLSRVFSLWNVDYVVGRFTGIAQASQVQAALDFISVSEENGLQLWERETASAFVQQLPSNRMLVIGDNPSDWLFAFPFASEGVYDNPADYSADYLANFSVIGLNRISSDTDIETALGDWVRAGNTLVVDMSGATQINTPGYTLFGVRAIPLLLNGEHTLNWTPELASLPSRLNFVTAEGGWVGATYAGLDETFGMVDNQNQNHAVLGYRNVGAGRVWFIGMNLFYLFNEAGQQANYRALTDFVMDSTPVDRTLALPSFDAEMLERSSTEISFRYDNAAARNVILSMTYFPRWQAFVDGVMLPVENHEHLIMLRLPAGNHTVRLHYDSQYSVVVQLGWLFSLQSLGAAGLVALWSWRKSLLSLADRADAFNGRFGENEG